MDTKLDKRKVRKWLKQYPILSETDFYPPQDNRVLYSNVRDVDEINNFDDWLEYYYQVCECEEIYD